MQAKSIKIDGISREQRGAILRRYRRNGRYTFVRYYDLVTMGAKPQPKYNLLPVNKVWATVADALTRWMF